MAGSSRQQVEDSLSVPLDVPTVFTRRRLREKTCLAAALGEEAMNMSREAHVAAALTEMDEESLLKAGVKRKNIHWTHVRTFNPSWVQPDQVTRQQTYEHLEGLYAEVYPDTNSPTKSVLAFGVVCQERHAAGASDAQRALHRHVPTVATEQVYWNRLAKLSLEKYNWPLNAVAHDAYHTMFAYVRDATPKKPLHELDAKPYFSPLHPEGEQLSDFLRVSEGAANRNQRRGRQPNGDHPPKRERCPSIYQLVKDHDISTVHQLRARACSEAAEGRTALAEFCAKHGSKLSELVGNARAIMEAPARLAESEKTLLQKLEDAVLKECCCGGCWQDGAEQLLERNQISPAVFCAAMRRALDLGASRGVNIACVGEKGCGKSTLLEPLDKIFRAYPKPQAGSTFGLTDLKDFDVMLWQDYFHDEKTMKFTDLLALFVGEAINVRLVGGNEPYRNAAPIFYSGVVPMRCGLHDRTVSEKLNGMMDDRFAIFRFTQDIPMEFRQEQWPKCGACAARFYLQTHDAVMAPLTQPLLPLTQRFAPVLQAMTQPSRPDLREDLQSLAVMHEQGQLDVEEYRAAKRLALRMM